MVEQSRTTYPAKPRRRAARLKYQLRQPIIIPAGTEVGVDPAGMRRAIGVDFASITVAVTKDTTAYWTMDLQEAVELGIVGPAEEQEAA